MEEKLDKEKCHALVVDVVGDIFGALRGLEETVCLPG